MPQQAASTAGRQRRAWTAHEDELLRNAVNKATLQSRGLVWRELAKSVPGRTNKDCRRRWWNSLAGLTSKGQWSESEDERMLEAFAKYGPQWTLVAAAVGTRHPDQCSSHWTQVLDPSINHSDWTPAEDETLCRAVNMQGTNWASIAAEHVPRRPPLALKNRYSMLQMTRKTRNDESRAYVTPGSSSVPTEAFSTAINSAANASNQCDPQLCQEPEFQEESDDDTDEDDDRSSTDPEVACYRGQKLARTPTLPPRPTSTMLQQSERLNNSVLNQQSILHNEARQQPQAMDQSLDFILDKQFNLPQEFPMSPNQWPEFETGSYQAPVMDHSVSFTPVRQFGTRENHMQQPRGSHWTTTTDKDKLPVVSMDGGSRASELGSQKRAIRLPEYSAPSALLDESDSPGLASSVQSSQTTLPGGRTDRAIAGESPVGHEVQQPVLRVSLNIRCTTEQLGKAMGALLDIGIPVSIQVDTKAQV
ncbi:hypothetical protein FJTKL_08327 [Diaporthe vaccinii]|uniref:Uncharacterized protein n=2 Tax=Diaporthe vaccinii TaxID=105482 RepID=A0ABR4ERL4_9PEZI